MANLFDVAYHGTNINPDDILKQGWKFGKKSGNSLPFQWGGQKAYVTPSSKLASTYGKNLMPVITSAGARSFPGGSIGSKGLTLAKETALTAPQFNRGAILAKKLQGGAYPNSAMANAARTRMANAPIKQSLIKSLLPTIMNMGSKITKFPNPIMTVLQGLAPTALGDGTLPEGDVPYTPFEQPIIPPPTVAPVVPTYNPPQGPAGYTRPTRSPAQQAATVDRKAKSMGVASPIRYNSGTKYGFGL